MMDPKKAHFGFGYKCAGKTVLELVIAMAVMVIIFSVLIPQLRAIQNSWDTKQGNAEVLQNGRILIDHLSRNLSKAVKITDISSSSETNGYIQFEDNDANEWRYEIGTDSYVEFGLVGSLSDLAGPVSKLQFTCYDCDDFANPTTNVNSIRLVEIEVIFTNSATLGQDKTFTASVYLRTYWYSSSSGLVGWWKLDETSGTTAADSSGNSNDGTLTNMAGDEWTEGVVDGALNFDGSNDYVAIQSLHYNSGGHMAVSVTAWIRTSNSGNQIIASYDRNEYWCLEITGSGAGSGQVGWDVYTSTGQVDYGSINRVDDGLWHHVGGIFDNGTLTIYIDGNPEPSASGGSTFGRGIRTRYGFLGVGSEATTFDGNKGSTNYFDGDMDDVRIYNRALSAGEISQLFDILRYMEFTEAKVSSDNTSITISTPSTSEGDLLIGAVATDGDTSASIAPPMGEGWTGIDIGNYGDDDGATLGAWWKLADASESSSHKFIWSGSQQAYGWIMQFTGHDSDDPIDVFSTYGESSSAPTSPGVTTTVDNCLILRLGAFDDDDITEDDPGLSGHISITMDESASSEGLVTYEEFTEAKLGYDGTSVTVSTPGGTSEGDLLIATVVTDEDTKSSLSPPSGEGWTVIDLNDYYNEVTLGVWWKLADASESPTHQFTWSGGSQAYGWIMRFTGHDLSTPINVSAAQGGYGNSPDCPSVITTIANTMIVRIGGFDDDDVHTDSPGLSGYMVITMDKSSSGNDTCSGGAGYKQQAAIGACGTAEFSLKGSQSEQYRTVTIAIAPATVACSTVSGGAGYFKQSSSGESTTSTFSLGSSSEARTLTIAIAPNSESADNGDYEIRP